MSAYALDVSARNFDQVVIEGSKRTPVLVDFWAEWCGPCRILKPVLEKLAAEYGGQFVLAKVNADENGELSARYGVRGIPAVKAFVDGTVADEFTGALPEREVRAFIDRLIPSPADELRVRARALVEAGDGGAALKVLAEASRLDPGNESVRVDAAEIMVSAGQLDEAKPLLAGLSPDTAAEPRVQRLLARLEFADQAAAAGDAKTLEARIAGNPDDLDARLGLANLLVAQQRYEPALDQLLEIVRRDRSFRDDIGRKTLLSIFDLLGGQGEIVSRYRRLLASALN